MPQPKVVGIGGSLSQGSRSLFALQVALQGAAEAGAEIQLFNLREMGLPLYSIDLRPAPQAAEEMCEAVYQAQGLIWCSPLYHGTVSGAFKNAIDWLDLLRYRDPPFLTDKIVGLISTAAGVQGLQAINTMEFSVRALRAWAVPLVIPVPRVGETFDELGNPLDTDVANQLRMLGKEVHRVSRQVLEAGRIDYSLTGASIED